jgi:16S rRNA (guanine527-N7)-methyltransferase
MTDHVPVLPAVLALLEEAGRRGFLGPRPARDHAHHAGGFAAAWEAVAGDRTPARACDIGSGAGVPGLVLATGCWPDTRWTLLDAMAKRCQFLTEAVDTLDVGLRVAVACGRAEQLGRVGEPLRSAFDLVTSRGFGRPSTTAEAAAPLLAVGGLLVVSEPPDSDGARWDADGCRQVGLVPVQAVRSSDASFMVLRQEALPEDRFPRSPKGQKRSPLF